MRTLFVLIFLTVFLAVGTACGRDEATAPAVPESFSEAMSNARGTTVTFYGWGGDAAVNAWIDSILAPSLLENYEITLNRVPMNIGDILSKLIGEKQGDVTSGDIDVVWINGENFYTAKNADLLFGPIIHLVDNFARYINPDDPDVHYDFGTPVEGMQVPYGRAQLVFIGDTAVLDRFPASAHELLELARANPGMITFPAPPDFMGSAFVRNLIYEIVGFDALFNAPGDEESIYQVIRPALDFMLELRPYLWQQGQTFPTTEAALHQMFVDGQVLMTASYTPLFAAQMIMAGEFPDTAQTFLFDGGNIGNTHYVAIPFNAPNKSAALVLIHHIISAEMQITKFDAANWGDLPVFDVTRLTAEQRAMLDAIDNGPGILTPDELAAGRQPEVQAYKIPIIDRLWIQHVLMAP